MYVHVLLSIFPVYVLCLESLGTSGMTTLHRCYEVPKHAHLESIINHSLQACEEVPGITTPPQSPPDNTIPTTNCGGVPVIPPHTAASDTSSLQGNASPCTQQEQKATPVNTSETLNKGCCSYMYCVLYFF